MKTFLQENKFGGSFPHSWHFAQYFAECFGGFGSLPQGKRNESRRELMHTVLSDRSPHVNDRSPHVSHRSRHVNDRSPHVRESGFRNRRNSCFWNLQCGKFVLVESKIMAFRFRNSALGTRNSANHWNPESKFRWQGIRNPIPGIRNPESMAWNPESSFEYLGRDGRQPEVGLFPSDMPWRYRICIFKCLFSYRNELHEDLGRLHLSKVQKDFTFDCPPSLKNLLTAYPPSHDLDSSVLTLQNRTFL